MVDQYNCFLHMQFETLTEQNIHTELTSSLTTYRV